MARTYILRNLTDGKGRPLANVWTRAYNATTGALTETQYTDSSGTCTFSALPDDANVNICATWGLNSKWFYSIFSATQDLLYLSVTDAVIGTCSITKLTAGNLTVTGTITTGKLVTGAAGTNRIEIDANYVAGYSAANVLQFYLSAADGKAYAAGGNIVIDSTALKIYGAYLWLYSGTTLVGDLNASSTTQLLLASNYDMMLMSGGTTRTIYLGPSGGNGVAIYNNLVYPDGTDKTVDLGSTTHRFRRAYCSPIIPIYNAGTSEAEEGSMTYSWNGSILTLLVYASGSWRMHPTV